MSDKDWYLNEDDSRYAVFLQVPDDPHDQYSVDLVRHAQDEYGLLREQRLTLAQYNSYGEAEEHFYEAEQQIQNNGLEDFDVDALAAMPYSDTPTILTAHFPPDAEGEELASTNILAMTEGGIQSVRIATGDIETQQGFVKQLDLAQIAGGDDHLLDEAMELAEAQEQHAPATPLFQADDNAVRHIDGAGTTHWFGIAEREDDADYTHELRYFRTHEFDDEVQNDSYPVMPLPDAERESAWVLPDLERHLQTGNIYTAQQMAHNVADFYGQDFPDPLDLPSLNPEPEYYFGYGVGPSDSPSLELVKTWMDGSERRFDTLTVAEYGMFEEAAVDETELEELVEAEGLESAMNLAETMAVAGGYLDPERNDPRIFFEDDAPADPFTTNRDRELAQPRYTIGAVSANGESFLDVYKEWGTEDYERLVVPQPEWEQAHDVAVRANDMLDEDRLEGAMHLIELEGMRAGVIDPDREDTRLFMQGPPDPFETLAERLQDEPNPYWNTDGEVIEEPEDEITVENPYWRLDALPVNDPDGNPLGQALYIVVYDGVEHDPERVGTPSMVDDEPFRMLEMAHFETTEAADKFGKEFNDYLIPGLLEGPELAVEVARLEELPIDWKMLEGDDLKTYQNGQYTLTREQSDWQPYNANAERDARIEAEGLYTDSIYDATTFKNEDEIQLNPSFPDPEL